MKKLLAQYALVPPHEIDYTAILKDTNIFGSGKHLKFDAEACAALSKVISEAEARLDIDVAWACVTSGARYQSDDMKVSCDLEYWAFFEPNDFSRVLYIGSGAYPTIAIYVLERRSRIKFDGIDNVPHCTVLCSRVAATLGLARRLRPFTADAMTLDRKAIERYDAFFISSAVKPKMAVIKLLLRFKRSDALIYAREDEAHPFFYEPVTVSHQDLITAKIARSRWTVEKGMPPALPRGCEVWTTRGAQ